MSPQANVIQVTVTDGRPISVSFSSLVTGQLLAGDIVRQETPIPAPDGITTVFSVANAYRSGSLQVYRDQSVLLRDIDFTENSPTSFTLTKASDSNEAIRADYIKQ